MSSAHFQCILFAALIVAGVRLSYADEASLEVDYRQTLQPLLRTYCFDCHGVDDEISLAQDESAIAIKRNRQLWICALSQIRNGTMPPEDGEKLDEATREAFADLIDQLANAVDCPATEDEKDRLVQLASRVRDAGGSYEEGIQVALQAILVSPHFLFKVERPASQDDRESNLISQYELATRISYFLWSSMPDDELLLLDNSMLLYGSGISDGDRHNHDDLPIILAGGGAGRIKTGRHIRYPNGTPLCNLYLWMMQEYGCEG